MRKIIASFLLVTCVASGYAQVLVDTTMGTENFTPKFSIGFSPLAIAFSKARLDLETGFGKQSPILLSVSPIFYTGNTDIYAGSRNVSASDTKNASTTDQISGMGAEIQLKFTRIVNYEQLTLIYAGIGVGFHNIKFEFEDYGWEPYEKDGLQYYRYDLGPQKETVKRTDVFGMIGGRAYVNKFLYFDGNVGMVFQNSDITSTQSVIRPHLNGPIDFGYTGVNLKVNFTVGVSLF